MPERGKDNIGGRGSAGKKLGGGGRSLKNLGGGQWKIMSSLGGINY